MLSLKLVWRSRFLSKTYLLPLFILFTNLVGNYNYNLPRDDFSPKFVALFTLLLFLKSFHWLAEDRVDYMERSPVITVLFHLRV